MKKIAFLLTFISFFFQLGQAQNITGSWNGILNVTGTQLHIIIHIKDSATVLTATMDSPDQYAKDIPISKITFNENKLYFEVADSVIVYKGQLINNDSIKGTFRQSGLKIFLVLHRGYANEKELNRPQRPKPPFPYESEKITFSNTKAGIKLAGTLTIPKKGIKFPAVVLITGSGPQDRDETILGHKPFLVIADFLSRRGIAVLRFDDRGTAESEGDFSTATTADFTTDVEAAVQYLKSRKEINHQKIGLIGHSEGGIIAPMVAAKDKSIDFIVLLAGPGFPGDKLLLMQKEALGKAVGASEKEIARSKKLNKELYKLILKGADNSLIQQRILRSLKEQKSDLSEAQLMKAAERKTKYLMNPWMAYFLTNDPRDYLEKVKCPVLALDGAKDLQVPAKQNIISINKALEEGGNTNVTTKIFSGLNHLFQDAETGLPREYGEIEETFSPEALKFMRKWIEKQVK